MIVAGCDVGSLTAKAVLMEGDIIMAEAVVRATPRPEESARLAMDAALEKAGKAMGDLACIVGTGYGRKQVPFVHRVESEIACHARGASHQVPGVRTVVDIGGQDAKAIRLDEQGNVARYSYNDKCASGTGRFIEVIADALELSLDELGDISAQSKNRVTISNQCVVFAETEVVSLINRGEEVADIVAGLHHALAGRVASLARSIQAEPDVVFTGGVAKNSGVARSLAEAMGMELKFLYCDPQINGALGAALYAREAATERKSA
ncbi:MAG: acyl-CoA dehydratase activase [Desulfatibacillaceae bacterium]